MGAVRCGQTQGYDLSEDIYLDRLWQEYYYIAHVRLNFFSARKDSGMAPKKSQIRTVKEGQEEEVKG